jgi:hypothetical protein
MMNSATYVFQTTQPVESDTDSVFFQYPQRYLDGKWIVSGTVTTAVTIPKGSDKTVKIKGNAGERLVKKHCGEKMNRGDDG